jgi:hypothetical protein
MRRVLVDHARERRARNRGGGLRVTLVEDGPAAPAAEPELIDLDEALEELGARDAGGKVLDAAAAQVLEAKTPLVGFSPDGLSLASTGSAPGQAGTADASTANQGAGKGGIGKAAIIGGVAGAAALVAVVAGGGGGGEDGAGGGDTAGEAHRARALAAPPTGGHHAGRRDDALRSMVGHDRPSLGYVALVTTPVAGMAVTCTVREHVTADITQSGSSATINATTTPRSMECSFSVPGLLEALDGGTGTANATVSGNTFTFSYQRGRSGRSCTMAPTTAPHSMRPAT